MHFCYYVNRKIEKLTAMKPDINDIKLFEAKQVRTAWDSEQE